MLREWIPDQVRDDEGLLTAGKAPFFVPNLVIPAKARTQSVRRLTPLWVPAFAGMTKVERAASDLNSVIPAKAGISPVRHDDKAGFRPSPG